MLISLDLLFCSGLKLLGTSFCGWKSLREEPKGINCLIAYKWFDSCAGNGWLKNSRRVVHAWVENKSFKFQWCHAKATTRIRSLHVSESLTISFFRQFSIFPGGLKICFFYAYCGGSLSAFSCCRRSELFLPSHRRVVYVRNDKQQHKDTINWLVLVFHYEKNHASLL